MAGINKVTLVGRLGKGVELKYTPNNDAVANLSIATSENWTDKNGQRQEKTEWHRVVFFTKLAEIANQYLKKGSQVYIEGKLQTRKWTDRDGIDRYTTEIIGKTLQMLNSKSSNNTQESEKNSNQDTTNPPTHEEVQDDDLPF